VIVALKQYSNNKKSQEISIQREALTRIQPDMSTKCVEESPMLRSSDDNFSQECTKQRLNDMETEQKSELQLHVIKSLYNAYIPEITSTTVDCHCSVRKLIPSHSHVISLMEHALEANNALIFHSHMHSLKNKCNFFKI